MTVKYRHMKIILVLFLCCFLFFSNIAFNQELPPSAKSIHLTFKVLGWQSNEAIGIKYSGRISKKQMQTDMAVLAEAHGWRYTENSFEIKYEEGKKVAWQNGALSRKHRLTTDFILNLQRLREQFSDTESIVIDLMSKNGFAYHHTFISPEVKDNTDNLDDERWQNQFPFQKNWVGGANYRIRYILDTGPFPANTTLPTLSASASFSKPWLLKVVPCLVFMIFLPSATLHMFLQRGISYNERGKIKLGPLQVFILNAEGYIGMGAVVYLGCTDVCAALTRNTFLGFLLSVVPFALALWLILLSILHRYERIVRSTTWSFRENLLTNLRMIALGAPALLLPFCYFGTQKIFPELQFLLFLFLLLSQYSLLILLFAYVTPFIMNWIWKGKPLEDETLRRRLQQLTQKAKTPYQDIILLQTKSSKLANAWVAGILPKWRSVFVTDYLLEHLCPDEIETIFAHELGHLKHRHLPKQVAWVVLGFGGQLLLIRLSLFLFGFLTGIPLWLYWLLFVGVNLGIILFLVQFGLMPFWRRMEFEADAYAVELTQQPKVFLQALHKLIQLNDAPEDLDKFNEMLSTHPNFKARADAIEKLNLSQT